MTPWLVALTTVLVVALVWNLQREAPRVGRILKVAASTGFIAVAVSVNAGNSTYGRFVIAALALSWLGDLLLTLTPRTAFIAGIVVFLAAHVAFTAGFAVRGIDPAWLVIAGVALLVVASFLWRRLTPHVDDALRNPVMAYILVITVMVAAAIGTAAAEPDVRIALGAAAFYLSDLAVARNRFVAPGLMNRAVGLPMYYAGQVLLALSAGG